MVTAPLDLPVIIEPDDEDIREDGDGAPIYVSHWPKKPSAPPTPTFDLTRLPPPANSIKLKDFDWDALVQRLYTLEKPTQASTRTLGPLVSMSMDKIVTHLHQPGSSLPPICPCDTPNASETKFHWMLEELHHIMVCWCFWSSSHYGLLLFLEL